MSCFPVAQPTALHVVPPLVTFLANSPTVTEETLSSLKVIFCGAAPLGPALIERVLKKIDSAHGATFIEGRCAPGDLWLPVEMSTVGRFKFGYSRKVSLMSHIHWPIFYDDLILLT